jgi:hypothetical protein
MGRSIVSMTSGCNNRLPALARREVLQDDLWTVARMLRRDHMMSSVAGGPGLGRPIFCFPADYTGVLYVDTEQGARTGYLVEFGEPRLMFEDPSHHHTKQYIRGEFS